MNDVLALLSLCREAGVALSVDKNDQLKIAFKGKPPSPQLIKQIKVSKANIVKLLQSSLSQGPQKAPDMDMYPLSSSQKRMWFMSKVEDDMSQYHICMPIEIMGEIDKGRIEKALNASIERHEVLRTTYHDNAKGEGVQRVHQHVGIALSELSSISDVDRFVALPFDLSSDIPIRAGVLSLEQNKCHLVVVIHHIATDGWSSGILANEFMSFFNDEALPELDVQFKDFAYFEAEKEKASDDDVAYWKQRMLTIPTLHALPLDNPRKEGLTHKGGREKLSLTDDLTLKIRDWTSQHKITPFVLFYSAFALSLLLLSKQKDIVINTPVAGRRYASLKSMVGFFVDIMPVATSLQGDMTYLEFVNAQNAHIQKDMSHNSLTFEKVVSAVSPKRYPLTQPLSQIMLNYQNSDISEVHIKGLTIEFLPDPNYATEYEIEMIISEKEGFHLDCLYNRSLFNATRVASLNNAVIDVIQSIIERSNDVITGLDEYAKEGLVGDDAFDVAHRFVSDTVSPEIEQALSEIWRDTLGVASSALTDNFFEQGGTSLQAISMFNKIKEKGLAVTPHYFFVNPVFETLLYFQNTNESHDDDDFSDLEEFDI